MQYSARAVFSCGILCLYWTRSTVLCLQGIIDKITGVLQPRLAGVRGHCFAVCSEIDCRQHRQKSHLPIRIVYGNGLNIKNKLVRSAHNGQRKSQRKSRRITSRGTPDDRITCQSGFDHATRGPMRETLWCMQLICRLFGDTVNHDNNYPKDYEISEGAFWRASLPAFQAYNKSDSTP